MSWIFSVVFLFVYIQLHSCNVFDNRPIIKIGPKGSYFGFSVAQNMPNGLLDNALLVGAPLGDDFGSGKNSTGTLWTCPVTDDPPTDCKEVNINARDDFKKIEPKSGQWLGATVKSVPGKVLVCSPRYLYASRQFDEMRGMCYTLDPELSFENAWDPTRGKSTVDKFNLCQAGTSGIIIDDETAVIGAPGDSFWRGSVHIFSVANTPFMERNRTTIVLQPQPGDENKYSYQGMAVTAAKFFKNRTIYAVGAPRLGAVGAVYLYDISESTEKPQVIIHGEFIGSQFGYELATADVNNDGLPDLMVGAPFDLDKNTTHEGAVYVYINQNGDLKLQDRLVGEMNSRFGIAITALRDINGDKYEDIAVGAPYDNGGKVFIYAGTKTGKLKLVQVLSGSTFGISSGSFGYSLSGGLDMNNDELPDLLVGAFESDAIALFKANPVVFINTTIDPNGLLTIVDPKETNCHFNHKLRSCFLVEFCVELNKENNKNVNTLHLPYTLRVETARPLNKRAVFDNNRHSTNGTVTFDSQDIAGKARVKTCMKHRVIFTGKTSNIDPQPVFFKLNYQLENFSSINVIPQDVDGPIEFKVPLMTSCGSRRCECNLTVTSFIRNLRKDTTQDEALVWIYEKTSGADEKNDITLTIDIKNNNGHALSVAVIIAYDSQLTFKNEQRTGYCTFQEERKGGNCDITEMIKAGEERILDLTFQTKNIVTYGTFDAFRITWNTASIDKSTIPKSIHLKITAYRMVHYPSIVGRANPESVIYEVPRENDNDISINSINDIGFDTSFVFSINNQNSFALNKTEVFIYLPYCVKQKDVEDCLFYFAETPIIKSDSIIDTCTLDQSEVDPLRLSENKKTKIAAKKIELENGDLECGNDAVRCIKIKCFLSNLTEDRSFTITTRVRNSTLMNIYKGSPDIKMLNITPSVHVELLSLSQFDVLSTGQNKTGHVENFMIRISQFTIKEGEREKLELMYTLIAVGVGGVILAGIIVLLWKIGFFKRKRVNEMSTEEETKALTS